MIHLYNRQLDAVPPIEVETVGQVLKQADEWYAQLSDKYCAELINSIDGRLLFGYGEDFFVQVTTESRDSTPYVAIGDADCDSDDLFCEFLIGGTLTPVSRRYLISESELAKAISSFIRNEGLNDEIQWEVF